MTLTVDARQYLTALIGRQMDRHDRRAVLSSVTVAGLGATQDDLRGVCVENDWMMTYDEGLDAYVVIPVEALP